MSEVGTGTVTNSYGSAALDTGSRPISGLSSRYFAYMYLLSQGKTDRPSRLELGRQQQQNDDGPGLLGPAPGGGFNPLLFLQNAHSRGPAMSKFFFAGFFMSALCRWFRFAQLAKGKKSRP